MAKAEARDKGKQFHTWRLREDAMFWFLSPLLLLIIGAGVLPLFNADFLDLVRGCKRSVLGTIKLLVQVQLQS